MIESHSMRGFYINIDRVQKYSFFKIVQKKNQNKILVNFRIKNREYSKIYNKYSIKKQKLLSNFINLHKENM